MPSHRGQHEDGTLLSATEPRGRTKLLSPRHRERCHGATSVLSRNYGPVCHRPGDCAHAHTRQCLDQLPRSRGRLSPAPSWLGTSQGPEQPPPQLCCWLRPSGSPGRFPPPRAGLSAAPRTRRSPIFPLPPPVPSDSRVHAGCCPQRDPLTSATGAMVMVATPGSSHCATHAFHASSHHLLPTGKAQAECPGLFLAFPREQKLPP